MGRSYNLWIKKMSIGEPFFTLKLCGSRHSLRFNKGSIKKLTKSFLFLEYCLFWLHWSSQRWSPKLHAYLIRRKYLEWLGTKSTHWRATCRYDTDGVVFTDYMRTSQANCNILTLPENYNDQCFQFEFINIRGHECVNCTVPLWYKKGHYPLHTDSDSNKCELRANQGARKSEDNFGSYWVINCKHCCSFNSSSITQFWLGGRWKVGLRLAKLLNDIVSDVFTQAEVL